jgi:hypothetical protein
MSSRFSSHTACLESSLSVGNETVVGMTAILGYARVSTIGQDLDAQLAALSAAGIGAERVFIDKLSGSAKTARPGLAAMLDYARGGDTAVDRLGRSVAEVTRTIADLGERRILNVGQNADAVGPQPTNRWESSTNSLDAARGRPARAAATHRSQIETRRVTDFG